MVRNVQELASVPSNELLRYKGHHFSYIRRQRPLPLTSITVCVSTAGCWCCQGSVRWHRASSWSQQQGRATHWTGKAILE